MADELKLLSHDDYSMLQKLDWETECAVGALLSRNGMHYWTICPVCSVDDFCHAEGCSLLPDLPVEA